ncbi:MAG: sensor histidine kinase [Firmicutes bacterium]|nr:sensor histidine kinase [Bacillota bacterium]
MEFDSNFKQTGFSEISEDDTKIILHNLQERVKELTALHHASTLLQSEAGVGETMEGIAALIPPSWQYPEITHGRIKFKDMVVTTSGFRESKWRQFSDFRTKNGDSGIIEVFYTKEMPDMHEGPFLKEERDLIDSLARMLTSYFERKAAEENLIRMNESLDELVKLRTDQLEKTNEELRAQIAERINAEKEIGVYQEQLRRLSLELSLAEQRERQSIAVDLHDHIGQALAMIKLKLIKLQGNIIFCGYDQNIAEIREFLDQTIQYTRSLTFEISPPSLFELGLCAALEWLAEQMGNKHNMTITVFSDEKPIQLSDEIRMLIFRSVRELIVNAVKHSGASEMDIRMNSDDCSFNIMVTDNGTGFNKDFTENQITHLSGFGLFSIRERFKCLGGKMIINMDSDNGAEITLSIPLKSGICGGDHCGN